MANRKNYKEKLFKQEQLRKKNLEKKIKRKKVLSGRKSNERGLRLKTQANKPAYSSQDMNPKGS